MCHKCAIQLTGWMEWNGFTQKTFINQNKHGTLKN